MIKNINVFILCLVAILGCEKSKEEKVKGNTELLNINNEQNESHINVVGTNNAVAIGKNSSASTKTGSSENNIIITENENNTHIIVNGKNNAIAVGENSKAETQ